MQRDLEAEFNYKFGMLEDNLIKHLEKLCNQVEEDNTEGYEFFSDALKETYIFINRINKIREFQGIKAKIAFGYLYELFLILTTIFIQNPKAFLEMQNELQMFIVCKVTGNSKEEIQKQINEMEERHAGTH